MRTNHARKSLSLTRDIEHNSKGYKGVCKIFIASQSYISVLKLRNKVQSNSFYIYLRNQCSVRQSTHIPLRSTEIVRVLFDVNFDVCGAFDEM